MSKLSNLKKNLKRDKENTLMLMFSKENKKIIGFRCILHKVYYLL